MHSFVSEEFVELAHREKELLATHRVKGGGVTISGRVIEATLIVLSKQDFDVILGMDWLGENRALIDCETRIVTLRLPSRDNFTYKGATSKGAPSVITSLRVKKLILSGTSAFLASVIIDNSNKNIGTHCQGVRRCLSRGSIRFAPS